MVTNVNTRNQTKYVFKTETKLAENMKNPVIILLLVYGMELIEKRKNLTVYFPLSARLINCIGNITHSCKYVGDLLCAYS